MPKYAAFLRAINLGKNRRVSGAELRELFEGAGLEGVATFRTSGNVVFEAPKQAGLQDRIEDALERELGYEVKVFLRDQKDLRAVTAHEPFDRKAREASQGKLQIALLPKKPSEKAAAAVTALATDADRLTFHGKELFWLPKAGTQESELDLTAVEAAVGPMTLRTKGTVEQLYAKFF